MERYRVEPVGSEPDILPGRLMRDDDRDTSGKRAVRCTELTGTVQGQMHSLAFAGWPLNQPRRHGGDLCDWLRARIVCVASKETEHNVIRADFG